MAAKSCFENLDHIYIQALLAMIFVSFGYIYIRTIGSEICLYTRINMS
jgi:hypothetical protein